jgi:hypothetical protein
MPTDPAPGAIEIRNRSALFGWFFVAVVLALAARQTWNTASDGLNAGQYVFWALAIWVAWWVFSTPVTCLRVAPDGGARFVSRRLFDRTVEDFPPGSIAAIYVRFEKDSNETPYWRCMLVAADGRERMIDEDSHAAPQYALAARLRAALALAESAPPA